jgi:hypothetical protein
VERTERRLEEMLESAAWQRSGDTLVYRDERDRVTAVTPDFSIDVDGTVTEWVGADWHPLAGSDGPNGPTAAFALAPDTLYVAVRIPDASAGGRDGYQVGLGDNVGLVVQSDIAASRRQLVPDDQVVIVARPPASGAFAGRVALGDFVAKYLADNRALAWSEFLISTFSEGASAANVHWERAGQPDGWSVEFAIPAEGRDRLRLSLSVHDVDRGTRTVYSLASRNYPGNPATFAEVTIER